MKTVSSQGTFSDSFDVIFPYNEDRNGHILGVTGLLISRGTLISASRDATVRVWSEPHRHRLCHSHWITSVDFLSKKDRKHLITSSYDQSMRIHSLPNLELRRTVAHHTDYVTCCQCVQEIIATGSVDQSVVLYQKSGNEGLSMVRRLYVKNSVYSLCIVKNYRCIVIGSTADHLIVVDPRVERCVQTWKGTTWPVKTLGLLSNDCIATGSSEQIFVMDPRMGRPSFQCQTLQSDSIWSIEPRKGAQEEFFAGGYKGAVYRVDVKKNRVTIPIQFSRDPHTGKKRSILSMTSTSNMKNLYVGTTSSTIYRFSVSQDSRSDTNAVRLLATNCLDLRYKIPNFLNIESLLSEQNAKVKTPKDANLVYEGYGGIYQAWRKPNQIEILGWDTRNNVSLWDVRSGEMVEYIECKDQKEAEEKFREFVDQGKTHINEWYKLKREIGRIVINIDPVSCFNGNCVPFEAGFDVLSDQIVLNMGELFVRAAFNGLFTISRLRISRTRDLRRLSFVQHRFKKQVKLMKKLRKFAFELKVHLDCMSTYHAGIIHKMTFDISKRRISKNLEEIKKVVKTFAKKRSYIEPTTSSNKKRKKKKKKRDGIIRNIRKIPITPDLSSQQEGGTVTDKFDRKSRGLTAGGGFSSQSRLEIDEIGTNHFLSKYFETSSDGKKNDGYIAQYFKWYMFKELKEGLEERMNDFGGFDKDLRRISKDGRILRKKIYEKFGYVQRLSFHQVRRVDDFFQLKDRRKHDRESRRILGKMKVKLTVFEKEYIKVVERCENSFQSINRITDQLFEKLKILKNTMIQESKMCGFQRNEFINVPYENYFEEFYDRIRNSCHRKYDYHYYYYDARHPEDHRGRELGAKCEECLEREKKEKHHDPYDFPERFYESSLEREIEKHLILEGIRRGNISSKVTNEVEKEKRKNIESVPLYHGKRGFGVYSHPLYRINPNSNAKKPNPASGGNIKEMVKKYGLERNQGRDKFLWSREAPSSQSIPRIKTGVGPVPYVSIPIGQSGQYLWAGADVQFLYNSYLEYQSFNEKKHRILNVVERREDEPLRHQHVKLRDHMEEHYLETRVIYILKGIKKLDEITLVGEEKMKFFRKIIQRETLTTEKIDNIRRETEKKISEDERTRGEKSENTIRTLLGIGIGSTFMHKKSTKSGKIGFLPNEEKFDWLGEDSYIHDKDLYQVAIQKYLTSGFPSWAKYDASLIHPRWSTKEMDKKKLHEWNFCWNLSPKCVVVVKQWIHSLDHSKFDDRPVEVSKKKTNGLLPTMFMKKKMEKERNKMRQPKKKLVLIEEADRMVLEWIVRVVSQGLPMHTRLQNVRIRFSVQSIDEGLPEVSSEDQTFLGLASHRVSDIILFVFTFLDLKDDFRIPTEQEWKMVKKTDDEYDESKEGMSRKELLRNILPIELIKPSRYYEEFESEEEEEEEEEENEGEETEEEEVIIEEKEEEKDVIQNENEKESKCCPVEYLEILSSGKGGKQGKVLDMVMNLGSVNYFYIGSEVHTLKLYYRRKYGRCSSENEKNKVNVGSRKDVGVKKKVRFREEDEIFVYEKKE